MSHPPPLFRFSFLADAAASAVLGLMLAAAATPVAALLALPEPLLRGAGLVLLPWAGLAVWLGTRPHLPRWVVVAVLAVNVLWVADSVLLLALGFVSPNALGVAFVLGAACGVGLSTGEHGCDSLRHRPPAGPPLRASHC